MKRLSLAFFILLITCCTTSFAEVKIGREFPVTFFKLAPKPQIVFFFASWSEPCQKEMAALSALYEKLKKKGIEITAVSLDEDSEVLSAPFPVVRDFDLVSPEKYQILVIPTTFVLNKDKTIKSVFVDFDDNVKKAIEKGFLSPE
ncbi:hypothetical protein A2276_04605 [candidate division WOR-1 bacterium RIFOXYA12_FULL_43_27]|uniref:Thioredoxin domain-containing protein n=1 Tax=candidate division WOR-1 bacterium RIFOXYC2_FULL_46_14 TaxID=1802587 RepID=A0A1F4U329_UNCSA|nr:MAG: hypothetical protein A2276_04605 [candidate division WOR-1 bacterium RIFOXYA12_FULL_43_27]OGC18894.1 MAG: hypothetical protein A2292_08230 [candidate division WOR-1 bacterium RIFOXYB2_FULL_46_45]OGC29035.1 MAG: hypothetical protein A2232_03295 [candidate division WOR-1 bacterium RIFOXYA2_FULL_46_56]OGC39289.1 MAG: hypothetical protein A2438_07195 [candidate division WOR-1 bacterium RIFOXYC2_FULL_46_14]